MYRGRRIHQLLQSLCSFALTLMLMLVIALSFEVRAQLGHACPKCCVFLPFGSKHAGVEGEGDQVGDRFQQLEERICDPHQ